MKYPFQMYMKALLLRILRSNFVLVFTMLLFSRKILANKTCLPVSETVFNPVCECVFKESL